MVSLFISQEIECLQSTFAFKQLTQYFQLDKTIKKYGQNYLEARPKIFNSLHVKSLHNQINYTDVLKPGFVGAFCAPASGVSRKHLHFYVDASKAGAEHLRVFSGRVYKPCLKRRKIFLSWRNKISNLIKKRKIPILIQEIVRFCILSVWFPNSIRVSVCKLHIKILFDKRHPGLSLVSHIWSFPLTG